MLSNSFVFSLGFGIFTLTIYYLYHHYSPLISIRGVGFLSVTGIHVKTAKATIQIGNLSLAPFLGHDIYSKFNIFYLVLSNVAIQIQLLATTPSDVQEFNHVRFMDESWIFRQIARIISSNVIARGLATLVDITVQDISIDFIVKGESQALLTISDISIRSRFNPRVDATGLIFLYGQNHSRLFGAEILIRNPSVRTKEMLNIFEIPNFVSITLLLADNQESIMIPSILAVCPKCQVKMMHSLVLPPETSSIPDSLKPQFLSQAVNDFLTRFIPEIVISTLAPKSVLMISELVAIVDLKSFDNSDISCGVISVKRLSGILSSSYNSSMECSFQATVKFEEASLFLKPTNKEVCRLSSLSFWNDITLSQSTFNESLYPFKIWVNSFFTLNDPVLQLDDQLLLELDKFRRSSSGTASRKFDYDHQLLDFLTLNFKITLLNFDAGFIIFLAEPGQKDFLISLTGKQLSSSFHTVKSADSSEMINVIFEHSSVALSTAKISHSPALNTPIAITPILKLPSSTIAFNFSSKWEIDSTILLQSIAIDLTNLAKDQTSYEKILIRANQLFEELNEPVKGRSSSNWPDRARVVLQIDNFSLKLASKSDPPNNIILSSRGALGSFYRNMGSTWSSLDIKELLLQIAPWNRATSNLMAIKSLHFIFKSTEKILHASSELAVMNFDVSKLYILIKCFAFAAEIYKNIVPNRLKGSNTGSKVLIVAEIPKVQMNVMLPNSIKGVGTFHDLHISTLNHPSIDIKVKSLVAIANTGSLEEKMEEFAELKNLTLNITPPKDNKPLIYIMDSKYSKMIIPNDWPLSNIIENGVNLSRVLKVLIYESFNIPIPQYFASGNTFLEPRETPSFFLKSLDTEIIIKDNPFESILGRNYQVGYAENIARLAREKEFMKKAKSKFPYMTQAEYISLKHNLCLGNKFKGKIEMEIAKAWEYLQIYNYRSYFKIISAYFEHELPPLMHTRFTDLSISATIPKTTQSLEKTLNEMDENTPPDLIYDDLIARDIELTMTGMEFRLRDYSNPLILLPPSTGTKLVMKGRVIIADPSISLDCRRYVEIPLEFDDECFLTTSRSVNPTKLYMETETDISTTSILRISLGTPFEPCIADVITIIDNFTMQSDDPSPPIGWWDKLRIVMHGQNTLRLRGGGKISLLALGSMSPYYDPRKHCGIEGMEVSLTNGLEIVFGCSSSESSSVSMSIECGELTICILRSQKYSRIPEAVCFAKFTGGIRIILTSDFITESPEGESYIPPWKKHHEIRMQTGEVKRRASKSPFFVAHPNILDSFHGFRSDFINVSLNIESPKEYYSSLAIPQNCFFFNSENMDGIGQIYSIYQSILTNVPIRRGNLFNMGEVLFSKPKLGRTIQSVHLVASFLPLMLSFILECEDGVESVGLRLRATQMNYDALFTQYTVRLISESILDRKPVTKWIRESNTVSFFDIEGRVIAYCQPESDLFIAKANSDIRSEIGSWIFKEDSFQNLNNVSLLPCIWAPKLDIIALESEMQTAETEVAATIGIMVFQLQLYQKRLAEMDLLIDIAKEKLASGAPGRVSVTFDSDIDIEDMATNTHELFILEEKRKVLESSIKRCSDDIKGKVPVRNIIFRMAEVETKNRFMSYCLSNAAAQVAAALVTTITKENQKPNRNHFNKQHINTSGVQDLLDTFLANLNPEFPPIIPCEIENISSGSYRNEEAQSPTRENFDSGENCGDDYFIENDVLVRFINPQIHFEIDGDEGEQKGAIILSAIRMQVKFLLVMDTDKSGYDSDRQDTIFKFRNIWSFEDSQFLVQENNSIRPGKPSWIPLESLIDQNLSVINFGRIIDHAQVIFQQDKPNPLYTQKAGIAPHIESPTAFHVNLPVLRCAATSSQYEVFYDFFKNLILYRDPASGERAEKLKKMLFALEYSEDLGHYRFTVLTLQEKIRQTEFLLKYRIKGGRELSDAELYEIRRSWIEFRNDLFVLMESLQNLQNLELKRKSLNISWQLAVNIDEFIWLLLLEDGSCLCRWVINYLNFGWTSNEDQSNINTLEIDTTKVENLSQAASIFREVISPYNPDGREINYEKQKMIRIYWKESAPVGGIQVVAHFEVNIEPLLIQVTYEFGKQLTRYFFPSIQRNQRSRTGSQKLSSALDLRKSQTSNTSGSDLDQLQQMQERASQIKSFIYIKVPGVQHCMSYRGSKEKNFEDLNMFSFYLPTLEYRNKTWSWLDFVDAIKKGCFNQFLTLSDAFRAALANTGALVREKLFTKKNTRTSSEELNRVSESSRHGGLQNGGGSIESLADNRDSQSSSTSAVKLSKAMNFFKKKVYGISKKSLTDTTPTESLTDLTDSQSDEIPASLSGRSTPVQLEIFSDLQKARIIFG